MSKGNATCEEQHGEYASGNIYLRPAYLGNKGSKIHGHKHHFGHTMFFTQAMPTLWEIFKKWVELNIYQTKAQKQAEEDARSSFGYVAEVKRVWPNGDINYMKYRVGEHAFVEAECEHEITSLADRVRFTCIYSHRDPQGEVVQEMTGWEGSMMPNCYDAKPE